jgi:uncharacterized protein with HEPN domain
VKHPEHVEDYLEHIVEAIERATRYLQPSRISQLLKRNLQTTAKDDLPRLKRQVIASLKR